MNEHSSSSTDVSTKSQGDLTGAVVAGKYRITRALGRGSAGTVYLCWHLALDKQVALKVLHPELTSNPGMVARFQREAQAAARLEHANSIHVMDFGHDEATGVLYLAMEYVEARDLGQVLAEDWPLSDERIVSIMSQVLSALSAAHALGIVHRDLKPENILVRNPAAAEAEDRVLVCDFGIAQLSPIRLSSPGQGASTRPAQITTGQGMVVGTPGYMSPEQARAETQDARSDIYSAGVVLFQLLTRTLPFMAQTPLSVAVMHCTTPPPPPSGFGPVNPALEAACLKALSKTREARYQTAREMQTALEAALTKDAVGDRLSRRISAVPAVIPAQPAARMHHPSIAPSERVIAEALAPKRSIAPAVVLGLVACILALGWLPRYLASDSGNIVDTETVSAPEPQLTAATTAAARPKPEVAPTPIAAPQPEPIAAPAPITVASVETPAPVAAEKPTSVAAPTPAPARNERVAANPPSRRRARAEEPRKAISSTRAASVDVAYAADAPSRVVNEPVAAATAIASAVPDTQDVAERPIASPLGPTADLPASPSLTSALETAASARSSAPVAPVVAAAAATPPPAPAPVAAPHPVAEQPAVGSGHELAASLANQARVVISDPFTRAGVSKASIMAAINQSSVTRCYQDGLRSGAGPTHTVSARLDISTNMGGRITFASVHGSEIPQKLRDCIEHVTRQGRVREVDTGEAQASVTLTFQVKN